MATGAATATMANDSLGNLEEFFDFAGLDDGCDSSPVINNDNDNVKAEDDRAATQDHGLVDLFPSQDIPDLDFDGMDWQPDTVSSMAEPHQLLVAVPAMSTAPQVSHLSPVAMVSDPLAMDPGMSMSMPMPMPMSMSMSMSMSMDAPPYNGPLFLGNQPQELQPFHATGFHNDLPIIGGVPAAATTPPDSMRNVFPDEIYNIPHASANAHTQDLDNDNVTPIDDDVIDAPYSSSPPTTHDQDQGQVQHQTIREDPLPPPPPPQRELPVRQPSSSGRTPASAKRKGPNTRIPLEARQLLEDEFATNPYPCSWEIDIIAHQAGLEAKKVRNWFNNARARKKGAVTEETAAELPDESTHSLATKLSAESLEELSMEVERGVLAPQPPLATYLASSYREEAADLAAIQAAIKSGPPSSRGDTFMDSSSGSRVGRSGSVITSVSSDTSAPTTYTMSSKGSNRSSFGRDRRRGRRRMTWRNSPYSRAKVVNGVDDSGTPAQGLPFFCTFCPRAFKTKYEWIRHEDSVHALRTTWICCNTKEEPFQYCPFCGQKHPDEVHMASHKYQQCRNKPETQRTFYRRDHFVQHLHHVHFANMKHPSAKLGCQTKLTASEGHDYGCKDLALKWRRFGAPMRVDDPMLHCGFCGHKSEDWDGRCNHVADHLIAGGFDRSAWWPDRSECHLENMCASSAVGPFRCRYCRKVFANAGARDNHTHCRVWSCRFLRTFDDIASENAAPPLCPQFPSPKAHHCHMCGAGYKSSHIEHAQQYHKYHQCKQKLYTSELDFLNHLHEFHGASHPVLLQHNAVLEQHFSRNKGAAFEPVEFNEILQGCRVGPPSEAFVDPFTIDEDTTTPTFQNPYASYSQDQSVQVTQHATQVSRKKAHYIRPDLTHRHSSSQSQSQSHLTTTTTTPPSTSHSHSHSHSTTPTTNSTQPPHHPISPSTLPKHKSKEDKPAGPRFFRLDPLVPFLSSRIYYLRNAKMSALFSDGDALLEELPKGHIASLVMASGLLGMAGVRMQVGVRDVEGVVEFGVEVDE